MRVCEELEGQSNLYRGMIGGGASLRPTTSSMSLAQQMLLEDQEQARRSQPRHSPRFLTVNPCHPSYYQRSLYTMEPRTPVRRPQEQNPWLQPPPLPRVNSNSWLAAGWSAEDVPAAAQYRAEQAYLLSSCHQPPVQAWECWECARNDGILCQDCSLAGCRR